MKRRGGHVPVVVDRRMEPRIGGVKMNRVASHNEWFEAQYKGKRFRRPRGTVIYRAEAISHDTSYEQTYNFIWSYVRLRNLNTGKTVNTEIKQMSREWVEVE